MIVAGICYNFSGNSNITTHFSDSVRWRNKGGCKCRGSLKKKKK